MGLKSPISHTDNRVSEDRSTHEQNFYANTDPNGPSKHPGNILLVDDEPVNVLVLQEILQAAGYQPSVAHDGRKALDAKEYRHAISRTNIDRR